MENADSDQLLIGSLQILPPWAYNKFKEIAENI